MIFRRRQPSPYLPPELDRPEVPPKQLTMTVPELMDRLKDPSIRAGVVHRLSPLVKGPNRAERRGKR